MLRELAVATADMERVAIYRHLLPVFADALEIADSCARSDIECNCECSGKGAARWYRALPDPDISPEENEWLPQALRYLTARGLIERHPDNPDLVRFTERAA
jgi:hypothetical protein